VLDALEGGCDLKGLAFVLPITLLLVASCAQPDSETKSRLATLESENKELQDRLLNAELQLAVLDQRIRELENVEATFDPTDSGFLTVRTNNGHLLVSCEDLVPYGDGQKMTLKVGNPYNLTFNGFTLSVRFGRREPQMPDPNDKAALAQWRDEYSSWNTSLRYKTLSLTDKLAPGAWNTISFVLAPAGPEDVGFIGLGITTSQVSLFNR